MMVSQDEGDLQRSQTVSAGASSKSTPPHPQTPNIHSTGRATVNSIETPDNATPATSASHPHRSHTPLTPLFRKPESPRSGEPNPTKAAKIAIPRLKRSVEATAEIDLRQGGRHRVNHACEPCRHRKTKCSGERPVCRHCQDFRIQCHYADGKRDRVKKQFGSMAEKVADYEKLLSDLSLRVGEDDAALIRSTLEREGGTEVDSAVRAPTSTVNGDVASIDSGDESDASAAAGSTGALDKTDEDFTRPDAKDTGFMGKNSELTWMQKLRQENMYGSPPRESADPEVRRRAQGATRQQGSHSSSVPSAPPAPHEDGFAIHETSYFLDDLPISTYDAVDPYELPTREMANKLFGAYIARVHPSFPIVGMVATTRNFENFVTGRYQNPPENSWRAILNLIFAIGAKYSHLIQAEWQGDDRDHLIYFTRARMLSMNGDTVFEHPGLQQIQVTGLMSFYMLCTSQVNRYVESILTVVISDSCQGLGVGRCCNPWSNRTGHVHAE